MKNLKRKKDNYINDVIYENYIIENIILNHYEHYYYVLNDNEEDSLNYNVYIIILLELYYETYNKLKTLKNKKYLTIIKKLIKIFQEILLNTHNILYDIVSLYKTIMYSIYCPSNENEIIIIFYNKFIKLL